MTVYVDELFTTQRTLTDPQGKCIFGSGRQSCHLTADTPGELHVFAARLGLKRAWVQHEGRMTVHYDLTPSKRRVAVILGAIETSSRDEARRIAARLGVRDKDVT